MPGATPDRRLGLIDQLLVICMYRKWQNAAAEVRVAYERFSNAPASERAPAFEAYREALDREAAAARVYAGRVRLADSTASIDASGWATGRSGVTRPAA